MWPSAGERRQLFARHLGAPEDAPLVFMPEGGAEELRERCRAGDLICPVPNCPAPAYVARGGATRRHHFAHRPGGGGHAPESYFHQVAKFRLADWVRRRYPRMRVGVEVRVESGQIADVLITSPRTGARVALEVQFSALSVDEWRRRTRGYTDHAVQVQWLFGHLPPHLRRVPDEERVRIGDLHRAMLVEGMPVFFIHPDHGLVAQMIDATMHWAFDNSGSTDLPAHPGSDGWLSVHRLDTCKLGPAGLEPPNAHQIRSALDAYQRKLDEDAREWQRQQSARKRTEELRQARRDTRPPDRSVETQRALYTRWIEARPVLLARTGPPPSTVLECTRSDELIHMDPGHWKHALWARAFAGKPAATLVPRSSVFAAAAALNRNAPGALDGRHRAEWAWEATAWWLWHLRAKSIVWFTPRIGPKGPFITGDIVITGALLDIPPHPE